MVLMLDLKEKQKLEHEVFEREIIQHKISTFEPKVRFCIEVGNYILKTADTAKEIRQVIDLRSHSFMSDFTPGFNSEFIDFDDYDLMADHILVLSRDRQNLLGSYRIICSKFANTCYSREQFDLGSFASLLDTKIELGRACIHKDFRNGTTLNLVWKGIAQYAMAVSARYMFGCASVKTISRSLAYSIFWHLYPAFHNNEYGMSVLPKFQFVSNSAQNQMFVWSEVEQHIPSLLKSYFQAGAKICSEPALDTFFQCVDFLTVLDLEKIDSKYQRRYFGGS